MTDENTDSVYHCLMKNDIEEQVRLKVTLNNKNDITPNFKVVSQW